MKIMMHIPLNIRITGKSFLEYGVFYSVWIHLQALKFVLQIYKTLFGFGNLRINVIVSPHNMYGWFHKKKGTLIGFITNGSKMFQTSIGAYISCIISVTVDDVFRASFL